MRYYSFFKADLHPKVYAMLPCLSPALPYNWTYVFFFYFYWWHLFVKQYFRIFHLRKNCNILFFPHPPACVQICCRASAHAWVSPRKRRPLLGKSQTFMMFVYVNHMGMHRSAEEPFKDLKVRPCPLAHLRTCHNGGAGGGGLREPPKRVTEGSS